MPIHDWTRVIAGTFHDFQHEWLTAIKRSLNAGLLPGDYYAMAEQIAGGLGPDVLTLGNKNWRLDELEGEDWGIQDIGGLATAIPKARFTAKVEVELYALKQNRIAIRYRSGDEVVAIIEIISPGNKSSRHALDTFVKKSRELLEAGVHVLIIDLFPPSRRDPQGIHGEIWGDTDETDPPFELPADEPQTLVAYTGGLERLAFIEPVAVAAKLPDMPLFLRPPGHVLVPLEASYQTAFEGVPQRWRRELV